MSDQKIYYKHWPEGVPKEVDIPNKTLIDFLEDSVKAYPDNIVTYFMGFELTYTMLLDIVYRVATKLTELGIKKGDCVAIQFTNNPAFIAYYYGILKIGGIVTPISPLFKKLEIKRQLIDSDAKVYIGWEGFMGLVDPIINDTGVIHKFYSNLGPYLTPDPMAPPEFSMEGEPPFEDLIRETLPNPPVVEITRDDLAQLQYTGGTTGFPKGAMLTHGSIAANEDSVKAYPVTVFPGVAAIYNNLNIYEGIQNHDLSSIKYCLSSAGPLPDDVRKTFEELTGSKLREAYGLTEMSPAVTANPFEGKLKPGTIGMPFPNTDVKICDAEGNTLGVGEVGEIVVRGPQMMRGYYKHEEETKNTIKDGWLWTGDLGLMDEDGYFVIKDRLKNLIKYKGHSVYPTEVEDLLYYHEAIQECGVIGIIDDKGNENIKAYIVLKEEYKDKGISEQDIINWAKENMAGDKYPRFVQFIDEIPKTIVGKVLHRELKDLEAQKK